MRVQKLGPFAAAVLLALVPPAHLRSAEKPPETVHVTYHAAPARMEELLDLVRQQWRGCRRLGLMLETPHVLLSGKEDGGKPYLVEVLRWRDEDAPDSIPDHYPQIAAIWKRMGECVEKRGGHPGIEIEPMELLGAEPTGLAPAEGRK